MSVAIIEKVGLNVPEPWLSQGFARVWVLDGEAPVVFFSRVQAEMFVALLDPIDIAVHSDMHVPAQTP
jgi:hypothetical protein